MQVTLAAALALVAGCSFSSPKGGSPNGGDPDPDPEIDASISVDAPAGARCQGYSYTYNGHKYRLIESGMSWMQAKTTCAGGGGYLMKLDNTAEDNEAANAFIGGPREVWMGLVDENDDGSYFWLDGTPPSFTHWNGAAPNAGSPDCVVKDTYSTDAHWYPRNCTDNKAVICECVP